MRRVQHNQTHAMHVHAFMYPVNDLIADLVVGDVAPPGQDISLVQYRFRQTMLRFVERRRAHGKTLLTKMVGDDGMHALRIDLLDAFGCIYQLFFAEPEVPQTRLSKVSSRREKEIYAHVSVEGARRSGAEARQVFS